MAGRLVDVLGPRAAVVPMDGFHLSNDQLDRLGRRDRKGAPDTFDVEAYAALLARVRAGERTTAPSFDRILDATVPDAIEIGDGVDVIVTEGNYLLLDGAWSAVRSSLHEAWYVDTDDDVRRTRLVDRHARFGRTRDEAIAWARDVDESNAMAIAATRSKAHCLIDLHLERDRALDHHPAQPAEGNEP